MAERPRLLKISDEMRRWCAALEDEIATWPDVTSRPMFGMIAFYRGPAIFAAVPRTRAVETPWSILVKRSPPRGRAQPAGVPGAGWATFELQSEDDVGEALGQVGRAYERARANPGARAGRIATPRRRR